MKGGIALRAIWNIKQEGSYVRGLTDKYCTPAHYSPNKTDNHMKQKRIKATFY